MTNEEIKKTHPMGLRGIFNSYTLVKIIKSTGMVVSFIATLSFTVFLWFYYKETNEFYTFLGNITTTLLSLLPNLL